MPATARAIMAGITRAAMGRALRAGATTPEAMRPMVQQGRRADTVDGGAADHRIREPWGLAPAAEHTTHPGQSTPRYSTLIPRVLRGRLVHRSCWHCFLQTPGDFWNG